MLGLSLMALPAVNKKPLTCKLPQDWPVMLSTDLATFAWGYLQCNCTWIGGELHERNSMHSRDTQH